MVFVFIMLMTVFLSIAGMFPAQIYEREHRVMHHSFPQDILYSQIMRMEKQHQNIKKESAAKRVPKPVVTLSQLEAFRNLLVAYRKATGAVAPGEIEQYKKLSPQTALELFKNKTSDTFEKNEVLRNAYYLAQRSLGTVAKKDAFSSPDRRKKEVLEFIGAHQPASTIFPPIDVSEDIAEQVTRPSSQPVPLVEEQTMPLLSASSLSSFTDTDTQNDQLLTPPRRPVAQSSCFIPVDSDRLLEDYRPAQPLKTSPKPAAKGPQRKRTRPAKSLYTQQDALMFKSFFVPASQNNNNGDVVTVDVEQDIHEDTKRQRTD